MAMGKKLQEEMEIMENLLTDYLESAGNLEDFITQLSLCKLMYDDPHNWTD